MVYNMTSIENGTNILHITSGLNNLEGGLFMGLTLLTLFIIMFIILKFRFETTVSLLATSFSITIISILLWGAGLIGSNILFYPIIVLIVSVVLNVAQD